jgi:hypothetical protein
LKRIFFVICLACGLWVGLAEAQEWRYIGYIPAYRVEDIIQVQDNPPILISGARHWFGHPVSGGIYRNIGLDTNWEYRAFNYVDVKRLVMQPSYPGRVFALTERGMFASDDQGSNWDTVITYQLEHGGYGSFAVSPFDSSIWALGQINGTEGGLIISFDAGATWHRWYQEWAVWNIAFSREDPNILYFSGWGTLMRMHLHDSTSQSIFQFGNTSSIIHGILYHPQEPWWYVFDGDSLARYDEMSGDISYMTIPEPAWLEYSLELDPGGGLLLASDNGLYHVDYELNELTTIPPPVPGAYIDGANTTRTSRIVSQSGATYIQNVISSAGQGHEQVSRVSITLYPNPVRDQLNFVPDFPSQISICNILGQRVYFNSCPSARVPVSWSTSALSSGVYFYSVSSLQSSPQKKLSGSFQIVK